VSQRADRLRSLPDFYRFRRAGYQAIDQICEYYSTLHERPVASQVEPGYLRRALPSGSGCFFWCILIHTLLIAEAPDVGQDIGLIVQDYHKYIMPGTHDRGFPTMSR